MLKMNLSFPGQEPLIVETFLRGAFCPGNLITGVVLPVKAGASEGRAAPGSSLPFCRLCPFSPARGSAGPPRPPSLCCGYLPRSPLKFHLFHKVLQPTGFDSSFSFTVSSPEVRLNHSRISSCECTLPPPGKKETPVPRGHLTLPLAPAWSGP